MWELLHARVPIYMWELLMCEYEFHCGNSIMGGLFTPLVGANPSVDQLSTRLRVNTKKTQAILCILRDQYIISQISQDG